MKLPGSGGFRTRTERLAALTASAEKADHLWRQLRRFDVWMRIAVTFLTAVLICVILRGWEPPFSWRYGYVPGEMIVSRVPFKAIDSQRTAQLRNEARAHVRPVYCNDPVQFDLLMTECFEQLQAIRSLSSINDIPEGIMDAFRPEVVISEDMPEFPDSLLTPSVNTPSHRLDAISPHLPSFATTDNVGWIHGIRAVPSSIPTTAATNDSAVDDASGNSDSAANQGVTDTSNTGDLTVKDSAVSGSTTAEPGIVAGPAAKQETPGVENGTLAVDAGSADGPATVDQGTDQGISDTDPSTKGISADENQSFSMFLIPRSRDLLHYPETISPELRLERLRLWLLRDTDLTNVRQNVRDALAPIREYGLLRDSVRIYSVQVDENPEITVYTTDAPDRLKTVLRSEVRLGDGSRLRDAFAARLPIEIAEPLSAWWYRRLSNRFSTLSLDEEKTKQAREEAAAKVPEIENTFLDGEILVEADHPLGEYELNVLRQEYEVFMLRRPPDQCVLRATAMVLVLCMLFGAFGGYLRRFEPRLLLEWKAFLSMHGLILTAVVLMQWASGNLFRAEIVPILLLAQITALAYRRETAMLIAGLLTAILAFGIGRTMPDSLAVLGVAITVVMPLASVRSRRKLIHVGFLGAVVAFLLVMLAGILGDQPFTSLISLSCRTAFATFLSCFALTGLLPYIEKWFGVLTDISLLELGDITHPLLQELVRRAPSTYNHSITVGAIGEAAADAIGARGLLVRIGAYYHDIGKMLKPGYFVENLGGGVNRHDSLNPAMSALVIVAHVKDGADLAETRGLPQPIVDLVLQHHGTSRIEYFYRKAVRMVEEQHQKEQKKLQAEDIVDQVKTTGTGNLSSVSNDLSTVSQPAVVSSTLSDSPISSDSSKEHAVADAAPSNSAPARTVPSKMMVDPRRGPLSNPGILIREEKIPAPDEHQVFEMKRRQEAERAINVLHLPEPNASAVSLPTVPATGNRLVTDTSDTQNVLAENSTKENTNPIEKVDRSENVKSEKMHEKVEESKSVIYDLREKVDETLIDESLYRYPGPKPQTKEAGVLMLADCAESACRSLQEPGPAAIEDLVRSIAEQRLDDGQFDESGLTLRELHTIEQTMIRALIAHYHGRIRYPGQKQQ
ncbi:MAG: HDIG domain-containing protein [Thermoguttaceae bacterium]|nr:HDIG domain-containing protein [Thermoguttaceae bacterium]